MQKVNARTVTLTILFLLILVVVALLIGNFTTAYLGADVSDDVTNQGETTASGDTIIFSSGNTLSLHATTDNFNASSGNLTDTTNPSARLIASSRTNEANATYYAGIRINANTFTYSSGTTADVILTVRDETGALVTTSDDNNLSYVTVTDASGTSISGFDITGKTGAFNISIEHPISTTSSTSGTTHTWTFTLTFVNYTYDQSINENATLDMDVVLQKDEIAMPTLAEVCDGKTFAECITTEVYTEDGDDGIYYHDGIGSYANANLEAEDNSYRYTGANPNNYICFGSDESICPDDNLYRIIGVFDGQVKLIKSTYATSNLLGTDGTYQDSTYYYWTSYVNSVEEIKWEKSDLNTVNLNTNYINSLGSEWSDLIAEHTWQVGGINSSTGLVTNAQTTYNYEVGANPANTTYSAKIGLMYVSDFGYSAIPEAWSLSVLTVDGINDYMNSINSDNNWLLTTTNFGDGSWTISSYSGSSNGVYSVVNPGIVQYSPVEYSENVVCPSFYLESSVVLTGGTGTASDPYRIS